jgi:H+/Cl- antiporter ClcA
VQNDDDLNDAEKLGHQAGGYHVLDFFENASYSFEVQGVQLAYQTIKIVLFLVCIGIVTSLIAISMDYSQAKLFILRNNLFTYHGWYYDVALSLGMALISSLLVQYVSLKAIGSGIPEMKSVLSGLWHHRFLSSRALIAKSVGLTLSGVQESA